MSFELDQDGAALHLRALRAICGCRAQIVRCVSGAKPHRPSQSAGEPLNCVCDNGPRRLEPEAGRAVFFWPIRAVSQHQPCLPTTLQALPLESAMRQSVCNLTTEAAAQNRNHHISQQLLRTWCLVNEPPSESQIQRSV